MISKKRVNACGDKTDGQSMRIHKLKKKHVQDYEFYQDYDEYREK